MNAKKRNFRALVRRIPNGRKWVIPPILNEEIHPHSITVLVRHGTWATEEYAKDAELTGVVSSEYNQICSTMELAISESQRSAILSHILNESTPEEFICNPLFAL